MYKLSRLIIDKDKHREMANKVGKDVEVIFSELRDKLGGRLPAELSYGIVAGYLRGKGYTWEESFAGMDRFASVVGKLAPLEDVSNGTFSILGNGDGSVTTDLK